MIMKRHYNKAFFEFLAIFAIIKKIIIYRYILKAIIWLRVAILL